MIIGTLRNLLIKMLLDIVYRDSTFGAFSPLTPGNKEYEAEYKLKRYKMMQSLPIESRTTLLRMYALDSNYLIRLQAERKGDKAEGLKHRIFQVLAYYQLTHLVEKVRKDKEELVKAANQ